MPGADEKRQAESSPPTSVLVVDDHAVFAEALTLALAGEPGLESVGYATTVEEGLTRVDEYRPDVVVIDAYLPRVDGIEGTRRILERQPQTTVLVITGRADARLFADAAAAGASGFLQKEMSLEEIAHAVHSAAGGVVITPPAVLEELVRSIEEGEEDSPALVGTQLTPREREVLGLLGEGSSIDAIAAALGISPHTCRDHVKNLLMKFGVHSQLELVVTAARAGVLPGLRPPPRH